jgi:hypothetical protein
VYRKLSGSYVHQVLFEDQFAWELNRRVIPLDNFASSNLPSTPHEGTKYRDIAVLELPIGITRVGVLDFNAETDPPLIEE